MKKLMGMLTAGFICVTATGCSAAQMLSSPPQPKITGSFAADCTVTAYIIPPGENAESETEFTFSGHAKRLGSGFWSMEITSPDTISGLEVSAADDVLTSRMGELAFDVQTSELPDAAPLTAFFSAMDNAAAQLESTPLSAGEEGGWVYSGSGCTIIFDGSGVPVSLAVGQPKMTVTFSDFTAENLSSETTLPDTSPSETTSEVIMTEAQTTVSTTAVETVQTTSSTTFAETAATTVPGSAET